jgi:hypothetical protein
VTSQRIIYPTDDGGVAIVIPTPEWLANNSIEVLAKKDVPAGVPYKIVSVDDIPSDRTFRSAWEADLNEPDGYGIGAEAWFAEQAALNATASNGEGETE